MKALHRFALWLLRDADVTMVRRVDYEEGVNALAELRDRFGPRERGSTKLIAKAGGLFIRAVRDPLGPPPS